METSDAHSETLPLASFQSQCTAPVTHTVQFTTLTDILTSCYKRNQSMAPGYTTFS